MLRTLLESQAAPARRSGGTLVSIGVHTAAIALALSATARATSVANRAEPPLVHLRLVTPRRVAPIITESRRTYRCQCVPVGTKLLIAPISTSYRPPEIDVIGSPRVDDWCIGCARTHLLAPVPGGSAVGSSTEVYPVAAVEKAAAPRPGNPAPEYPAALRASQLAGSVVARFIIDTTGRAEPASIAFPEATHPLFAEAVRQALLRSRYLPAMIGGRPVRQLVEQRFAFTLLR
jgi:protein TonB